MRKTSKKIAALVLSAVMGASLLAGCGSDTTSTSTSVSVSTSSTETSTSNVVEEVDVNVVTYSEAPMLAEQVAAGTLPAVEDRIPDQDNVFVETNDATGAALSIGTYGGEINTSFGQGSWDLSRPVLETIIHYNTDGSYYPNVIKAYEHNDDYTVWTFYLREGMKWSDGDDFNADDITFWYYMCHLNNYDTKKTGWKALIDTTEEVEVINAETGEPEIDAETGAVKTETNYTFATLTKVDEYTVTWTFTQPKYPSEFIENGDFKWCWAPSHYLADLIPSSYCTVENPYWGDTGLSDEQVLLNAQAKGIEQSTAKDLGKAVSYYWWNNANIPALNSFVLTETGVNNKSELVTLVRNPYYWKVDAEGNQLPYCDAINLRYYSEEGQDSLDFRSGNLDMIGVAMADINSIMTDMEAAGTPVSLYSWSSTNWGSYQLTFNYTTTDSNYATLFANADFRQAMSICVNRTEFSELMTDGFLDPGQAAPNKGYLGYSEEWTNKWTEYDVEKAKTLLEGCGLVMGADGYYDFADGTDLELSIYTYTGSGNDEAYTRLEPYFSAVGIKTVTKDMEVTLFDQEIDNNDWLAVLGPHTAIGGMGLKDRVAPFVPVSQAAEWYGEYGTYYQTNGASGVEPTGDMAKLVELYEQWVATPDADEKEAIELQIYELHEENLWTIAYLQPEDSYNLVVSSIKNYPDNLVNADLYQYANIVHYWTLYKED